MSENSFWAWVTAIDLRLSARLVIPPQARLLRLAALAVAHSGDSVLGLLAGALLLAWGGLAWREVGWALLMGTLVAGITASVLKRLLRRPRPLGEAGLLYARFDRNSFPSGHATRGACLVVLLAPLLPVWAGAMLALWAVLVGVARAALEVHFPSDVVGGWGIGAVVGGMLLILWRWGGI